MGNIKRSIAIGVALGVVAAWGGFGAGPAAAAPPSALVTCTKLSNQKIKVIDAFGVAKCTKKGKGVTKNWTRTSALEALKEESLPILGLAHNTAVFNAIVANDLAWSAWQDLESRMASPGSTLTTCTKNRTSKTKLITASVADFAKCVAKAKGVATTWSPSSELDAIRRHRSSQVLSEADLSSACVWLVHDAGINAAIASETPLAQMILDGWIDSFCT
jgi:hypothetical protein